MNWDFVVSIVSVIIALVALLFSIKQIQLSNKLALLDRRIQVYTLIKKLVDTYKMNREILLENKDMFFYNDLYFKLLTNMAYLENITNAITNVLEQDYQNKLLHKLNDMEVLAEECKFIFNKKCGKATSDFIYSYKELLWSMYCYQIIIKKVQNDEKQIWYKDLETSKKTIGEKKYQENLIEAIKKIESSFTIVENKKVMDKITKKMTL